MPGKNRAFVAAVKATGRKRLVMGGIVTAVCLAFPAIDALADGYEVSFIEDAVADSYRDLHDTRRSQARHTPEPFRERLLR